MRHRDLTRFAVAVGVALLINGLLLVGMAGLTRAMPPRAIAVAVKVLTKSHAHLLRAARILTPPPAPAMSQPASSHSVTPRSATPHAIPRPAAPASAWPFTLSPPVEAQPTSGESMPPAAPGLVVPAPAGTPAPGPAPTAPAISTPSAPQPAPVTAVASERSPIAPSTPVVVHIPVENPPAPPPPAAAPTEHASPRPPTPPALPAHGESHGARAVTSAQPLYPPSAREEGREGTVVLRVSLDAQAHVTGVMMEESAGDRRLDRAAERAVHTWTFAPALEDGRPVPGILRVRVQFRLE